MHAITSDRSRKTLIATLSGNIDINEGNMMLADFKKEVAGLNTKEYKLILNPENLSAGLFVIPILQSFIRLVSELHFKKVCLVNTDKYAALIRQQLGNTELAATLKFSSSLNEAIKDI